MFNIIRSLNYTARRETVNWITIISMLLMPVFVMFISGMIGDSSGVMTSSAYYGSQTMGTALVFILFGVMILACRVSAGDAGDKTINYEFMAGHSRGKIFAGRVIAGFLWGGILSFIIFILPLFYLALIYGWGPETDVKDIAEVCLLAFFPIMRLTAFNIMLATVTRSAGKGIALGYALLMVVAMTQSIVEEMTDFVFTWQFGFTNVEVLSIPDNSRNLVVDGKMITHFDTALTPDIAWKTILASVIFTAVYMIITYTNFKKKDRD